MTSKSLVPFSVCKGAGCNFCSTLMNFEPGDLLLEGRCAVPILDIVCVCVCVLCVCVVRVCGMCVCACLCVCACEQACESACVVQTH
jgi:hypothetical protein